MSNRPNLLDAPIRVAAAAIANARAGRRGGTSLLNVLSILPPRLFDEVVEDARAALEAAAALPPKPRLSGPLNGTDVDTLRLTLGASTVLVLVRDRQGRARAAHSAVSAEAQVFEHGQGAQDFWMAIARAMPAAAALLDPSSPSLARPDQETSP